MFVLHHFVTHAHNSEKESTHTPVKQYNKRNVVGHGGKNVLKMQKIQNTN